MGRTGKKIFFAASIITLGSASVFLAAYHTRPISYNDAYAILSLPVDIDDAAVVANLEMEGMEGIVSESSQWLMIDNFGELERIRLSEYSERIADFDPRDDGYAAKLRSFFINGSERRFYLPKPLVLMDGKVFTHLVSRSLARLDTEGMEGLQFSLDLGTTSLISFLSFYYIVIGVIALTVAAFNARSLISALLLAPVVISLSTFGPAALVAAGFLFSMAGPLKLGILEMLGRFDRSRKPSFGIYPVLLMPIAVLIAFILISATGMLPWLVSGLSFFCTLLFIVVETVLVFSKSLESGHNPFIPLVIMPGKRLFPSSAYRTLAPFVMAATFCLISEGLLFIVFPSFGRNAGGVVAGPSLGDYEAHLEFQRSFSLRRLGDKDSVLSYTGYKLLETGLITLEDGKARLDDYARPDPYPSELPPVERILKRMDHLPISGAPFSLTGGSLSSPSIITVVLSIFLITPMLVGKGSAKRRSKYAAFLAAKRMAA